MIDCHDCGNPVSPNARVCPQCGSTFPAGPARVSRRGLRANGGEQRNDQALMGMLILCTGIGFFYGAVTGGTWPAIGYGFVGAVIGGPAAFIINVSRRLFE
jgi:zinc-ribbon domain